MKKILSITFILFTAFVLVACGGNDLKVSGKEITDNEQVELALDKLVNSGGTSAIGDSFGVEASVKMSQNVDGVDQFSFDINGNIFLTLTEKLENLKLHAELELSGSSGGMGINGDAGLYVKDNKVYATGLASSQFGLPANSDLEDIGLIADEYDSFINSLLNTEDLGEMPDFEIPFEVQEVMDLLVEHKIVTVFEDKDKLSFVFHLTLEKLNAIALELGEEALDLEGAEKFDIKFTVILVENTVTFLEVELEIKMETVVDYDYDEEFNMIETYGIIDISAKLTFKNNTKMPAFPSDLEN